MKKIISICIYIMLALSTGITVSAESIEPPFFDSFEELNDYMNNLASHNHPVLVSLLSTFMIKTEKCYYLPFISESFNSSRGEILDRGITFTYESAEEQDEGYKLFVTCYSKSYKGKPLFDAVNDVKLSTYGPFSSVTDNQNNEVLISENEKHFFGFIDNKYLYQVSCYTMGIDVKDFINEISFIKVPLGTSNEDLAKLIENATSVISSEPVPVSSTPVSGESASNGQSSDTSGAPANPDTGENAALPVAGMAVIALGLITAGVVWRKKSKR